MLKALLCFAAIAGLYGQNQTSYVTYPLSEDSLPFRISIEQTSFTFPIGLQAYVSGLVGEEWVLLGGRTYGLHGFEGDTFPVASQNTSVFVFNLSTGNILSRSLADPSSQLTQAQIDQLSVTNALFFQGDGSNTLYMVGGYGNNSATGQLETKSVLTAIDLPSLINWVKRAPKAKSAAKCIRQTSNPLLQVTGGVMWQINPHKPALLGFGQNFAGFYNVNSNGNYTCQVGSFQVIDTGKNLLVYPYPQPGPTPIYRRRDLNIVPALKQVGNSLQQYLVAFGGVFTPGENNGAWTIPIEIGADGSTKSLDTSNPNTFAQGMNNYQCPTLGLYSAKTGDMYTLFFGGISGLYSLNGGLYAEGGSFCVDPNLGFTNDVTTIRIDSSGNYQQYFMSATYPSIATTFGSCADPTFPTQCNPMTPERSAVLLFGASAQFLAVPNLPYYPNSVLALDKLGSSPVLLGYIVGGIMSSAPETCSEIGNVDTLPSTYVFSVTLIPTQ
ncbi:MAG TPA: hypothetical protein VLF94_08545 [Chlamydiales bacterium]|nr:hypothetical protein [Chlamydiales bacterium]